MLTAIEIELFRGIRSGKVEGIRPLTVLVGPNGSGKSSILDAIRVAWGSSPGEGVQAVATERLVEARAGRWFLWRGSKDPSRLTVRFGDTDQLTIRLSRAEGRPLVSTHGETLEVIDGLLLSSDEGGSMSSVGAVAFFQRKAPVWKRPEGWNPLSGDEVRFLDLACSVARRPLHELRSTALERGRMTQVVDLVRKIVPTLRWIDLAIEAGNLPVVHMVYADHSVPISLEGDGVRALVQLCFELAVSDGGLVLLEEPEARLHPAAVRQSALAIVEAVRSGTQVVLTTHSMEFLDALIDALGPERVEELAVVRVALREGVLATSHFNGGDVAAARQEIGSDLR